MIQIEPTKLKELILRSEPDFIAQTELQFNGFGRVQQLKTSLDQTEFVWIWDRERVRTSTDKELLELVIKIID